MKLLCSCILLLLVLTTTFSQWVLIVQFNLNKKYIAEKLCVNRFKPRSCCKGKCFLAKQLNKQEKGDANMPASSKDNDAIQMYFEERNEYCLVQIATSIILFTSDIPFAVQSYHHSCFHPPQMMS